MSEESPSPQRPSAWLRVKDKYLGLDRWAKIATIATPVAAIVAAILPAAMSHPSSNAGLPPPNAPTTSTPTVSTGTAHPTPTETPARGWTSPNPILIPPSVGVDFDSVPPRTASGPDSLILYAGNELYGQGTYTIAIWTKSAPPTRDQCNALMRTQGNFEQPAEVGGKYCLLTGQGPGHTVYLKIIRIDASNTADVTAYVNAIVWANAAQ